MVPGIRRPSNIQGQSFSRGLDWSLKSPRNCDRNHILKSCLFSNFYKLWP